MSWELMSYGELMSGGTNVLDSKKYIIVCLFVICPTQQTAETMCTDVYKKNQF